jgi:hypothetical protein
MQLALHFIPVVLITEVQGVGGRKAPLEGRDVPTRAFKDQRFGQVSRLCRVLRTKVGLFGSGESQTRH